MLFIRSLGRLASSTQFRFSPSTAAASTAATNVTKNLITIEDSCLNRLRQILEKPKEEFLRINVETGGCSGFSYLFAVEQSQNIDPKEDIIFERENYRVIINKDVLPFLQGSSIEFHDSLMKSSFQIVNPIAETKCSCGSSFSIDLSKLQQNKN